MEYRAHVVYDRDVVAEAARRYVIRSIRWDGFAAFFLLLGVLAYLVAAGDRSWVVGLVAAVVLLMVVVGVALISSHTVVRWDASNVCRVRARTCCSPRMGYG